MLGIIWDIGDILRSSEMAGYWRGLCPAVDCDRLMMMMMMIFEKQILLT
jgi:hypothetical protein